MSERTRTIHLPEHVPARLRAALASMGASWHAGGVGGEVAVIAGGSWPDAIEHAVSSRAEAVLLVDIPDGLTAETRVPVIVELGWNHAPAASAAAPEFARLLDADSLVESAITGPPTTTLRRALIGHLALVREVVGAVTGLRIVRADHTGYDVLGTLAPGARVALAATFSDVLSERAVVRLVKPHESAALDLPSPAIAAPGVVRMIDGSGGRTFPTAWETSSRVSLRLVDAALRPKDIGGSLAALIDDVEQVTALGLVR